jgi:hypothetical protein
MANEKNATQFDQRNDHWISSRVLPLVSGTQRMTNTRVNALTSMYDTKVPAEIVSRKSLRQVHSWILDYTLKEGGNKAQGCKPPALQLSSRFAVIVIPKEVSQLASVAKLPARLLMLTGRIYEHNKSKIMVM